MSRFAVKNVKVNTSSCKVSNAMKIRPVGTGRTDRQTFLS